MLSPLNFQICQVVETVDPTQFDKYKDKDKDPETDLPPNSIRIRIRGKETSGPAEAWAIPADPTQLNVPLYGEQVLVYSAIDGEAEVDEDEHTEPVTFPIGGPATDPVGADEPVYQGAGRWRQRV